MTGRVMNISPLAGKPAVPSMLVTDEELMIATTVIRILA